MIPVKQESNHTIPKKSKETPIKESIDKVERAGFDEMELDIYYKDKD